MVGEERDLWFIPTQEHPTLLVSLGAPSPPASPVYAAVLSPLSGPRVHPGSPARDPPMCLPAPGAPSKLLHSKSLPQAWHAGPQ